jgi:hypothetical protein
MTVTGRSVIRIESHSIVASPITEFASLHGHLEWFSMADRFPQRMSLDGCQHSDAGWIQQFAVMPIVPRNMPSAGGCDISGILSKDRLIV